MQSSICSYYSDIFFLLEKSCSLQIIAYAAVCRSLAYFAHHVVALQTAIFIQLIVSACKVKSYVDNIIVVLLSERYFRKRRKKKQI